MAKLFNRFFNEEKGTVVIIIALAFVMLLGFVALSVDIGVLALEKTRLSRTMDAIALAGAQELPNTSKAEAVAADYAERNGVDPGMVTVSFSADNKKITATSDRVVNLYFAKALGFYTANVEGKASAIIVPVKEIGGLMPIGLNDNSLPLIEGQEYLIKAGAQDQTHGWRGIIKYPGAHGAQDYANYILNGYPGVIEIGDKEDEENGNVSGPTSDAVEERIEACNDGCVWSNYKSGCPRVALVPIYHDLAPAKKVEISGYATVFLERVPGSGNDSEVWARYIYNTVSGEADESESNYNKYLNTVRLSE